MRVDSEALLDLLPDMVVVMEPDSTVVYANAAATSILGWAPDELIGRSGFDFVHPDERSEAVERIAAQLDDAATTRRHHVELVRRDGGYTKFEMLAALQPGPAGRFLLVLRDVSERDAAQKRLHRSDEQLRALTENVPDALGRFDHTGALVFSTRSFDELIASNAGLVDRWRSHAATVVDGGQRVDVEYEIDEGDRWVAARFVPERSPDEGVTHVLVIATDVTARREREQRLVAAASNDPLTGLPNRRRFRELAERALTPGTDRRRADRTRTQRSVALVFIDLDAFKQINDHRGHATGDAVLAQVAHRLGDIVRPGDVVARFGGDEFVMLCRDVTIEDLEVITDRIAETVSEPITVPDLAEPLSVGVSVGVARALPGDVDLDQLLDRADQAMYRAKQSRTPR